MSIYSGKISVNSKYILHMVFLYSTCSVWSREGSDSHSSGFEWVSLLNAYQAKAKGNEQAVDR